MASEPIHKLPSGRWEVRYRDPNGRTRQFRFDTRTQAKDHLAKVRTRATRAATSPPNAVG